MYVAADSDRQGAVCLLGSRWTFPGRSRRRSWRVLAHSVPVVLPLPRREAEPRQEHPGLVQDHYDLVLGERGTTLRGSRPLLDQPGW
jgi:hypothetical protein